MKKILFALLVVSLANLVWADVPKTINYQGRLTDLNGNPVVDGTHSITVSLYVSASATTATWADNFSTVTKNGYFTLVLGSGTQKFDMFDFSSQYWIGLRVDTDSEMTPRQPLNSVPYALSVPVKSITTEKIADNATTQTWYMLGSDLSFTTANQTLTAATLTVTPAKDGVLFIWGKGALSAGISADFYLVTRIEINGVVVDGQEVIAVAVGANAKNVFALQYAQPVSGGTTYTIKMYAYTSISSYQGGLGANKLMAVVYYK